MASKRQLDNVDKSRRRLLVLRAVAARTGTVQLPVFSTFEVVAAFLHRAGFNAVVVAVFRQHMFLFPMISRSTVHAHLNRQYCDDAVL